MASKTGRHSNGHNAFPFGNPLWLILPKGTYRSPKLLGLQSSFEQSLAKNLRLLKPHDSCTFHSLFWLRQAIDALFVSRKLMNTLIDDLEFPISLWDEKWIHLYMDDSVKFLDVCLALISEVSRLEQEQIFLRYAQRILDFSSSPSVKQMNRAAAALSDWMQKLRLRSQKLEEIIPANLEGLTRTLTLPKVKNSAKGKVLMRAFYAFNVVTIFISNVLLRLFSCCSKPLAVLQVPKDYQWAEDFNDLQDAVNRELGSTLSSGKPTILKELDQVYASSRYLHDILFSLINTKDASEKIMDDDMVEEARRRCGEPILELSKSTKCLAHELELLEKRLDDLINLVMSGRRDVLGGLRASMKESGKLMS